MIGAVSVKPTLARSSGARQPDVRVATSGVESAAVRRPRVLVLITLPEIGGAQTYVASLLPGLAQEFDVAVAAHGTGWLAERAAEAGVRYVSLQHVRRPIDPLEDLRGLAELVRLLVRLRPDVVHANSSKAGILGRIAATLTGVPVRIFTVHGWAFRAYEPPLSTGYLWADRAMRRITTRTICVAQTELASGIEARTCDPARSVVIPNAVALDRGQRRHPERLDGPATVLAVGRFRAPKDFLTLVRAAALVPAGTVRVLVAGDGPDRPQLEAEIDRLGLAGTIELLGERGDVPELLAAADVFVLPSRSEGMPLSVLEAMAAGLPVVASRVGGVPELVRDGVTGTLVAPADPEALAAALSALAADAGARARFGAAGRARAEAEFGLDAWRDAHVALYRDALATRRGAKRTRR
jgi:glycosyltransferase involved in cell wall biosynthesis